MRQGYFTRGRQRACALSGRPVRARSRNACATVGKMDGNPAMRALAIGMAAGLCACFPGDFNGTKLQRSGGAAADAEAAGDSELDAPEDAESASPPEDASTASPMDAAADPEPSAEEDATLAEASVEAGAQDASMPADAQLPPPCVAPRTLCDGACIDPRTNSAYCGSCQISCDAGYACLERKCVSTWGCSDNTREGFPDRLAFPTIAGCAAAWPLASMRAARVQSACGNSAGMCTVPLDACAPGWHVCGNAANGPADVTARVTSTQCNTTPGRWAGALGDISCQDCASATTSGSICCGAGCVQQNNDCLWPGETAWFGVVNDFINLCTGTENPVLYIDVGVLCCRDAV
jgi:hypothetical protein